MSDTVFVIEKVSAFFMNSPGESACLTVPSSRFWKCFPLDTKKIDKSPSIEYLIKSKSLNSQTFHNKKFEKDIIKEREEIFPLFHEVSMPFSKEVKALKKTEEKFEEFLAQKGMKIYSRERFVPRTSRKSPLLNVEYSSFLDKEQRFKNNLVPLVRDAIRQFDLKIYFVMVTWWGRGDQARWTGSGLLATLKKFQDTGLCEVFLGYQEGQKPLSSLCLWAQKNDVPVFFVDRYELASLDGKEVIVSKPSLGKAENVLKSVKLIEQKTAEEGRSPEKTLLVFVDDDYTQYHWLNYFLLFAPWALSFLKKTGDKELDSVIGKIRNVSFIKSGSPRIILPYEIQEQITSGRQNPMDFLEVALFILDLAITHHRFTQPQDREKINDLFLTLRTIKNSGQIFTPTNRAHFLEKELNEMLEKIWREYIYRGGRVTQRLESIFRYLSHKDHYRWLRQFTYLLHGDQGAPLESWLSFSPFSQYALEISLILEAVWDKAFENHQVLNVIGLPHSHQRSKELAIWKMLDSIHMAFDLLRVLYREISAKNFLSIYSSSYQYPMLDRYGNVIRHQPEYEGVKIYPPLRQLRLRG